MNDCSNRKKKGCYQPFFNSIIFAFDFLFCGREGRVTPFDPITSFPFLERLSPFPIVVEFAVKNKTP